MEPERLEEYRRFVASRSRAWEELLRRLVRIPSTHGHEHAIVDVLAEHASALGVRIDRVPHDATRLSKLERANGPILDTPGRASVVATLPGVPDGPSLTLNAHVDVVPAGDDAEWSHPPFEGAIDSARRLLYGRGAVDNKAGVTIALAVLETLTHLPVDSAGDLVVHLVLEDETTGNGTLLCLDAGHRADAAVILDGTRPDRAIREHAGLQQFEIRVMGRPASVSVSHLGVNAIEMLARAILRLKGSIHSLNDQRQSPWTEFPSPNQIVVQEIHGCSAGLTVPDVATARFAVTFTPPYTIPRIRSLISEEIARFAREAGLPEPPQVDWTGYVAEPVQGDTGVLEPVLQRTAKQLGMPPIQVGPSSGSSDMRHYVNAGMPCVLYGPGRGYNAHRADEHFYLDDLQAMTLFYIALFDNWVKSRTGRTRSASART